jgi:hypothetical protein
MTHKNIKKIKFLSAGCFLWRAQGFFCSFVVLYGGLGIGELPVQLLIIKFLIFFSCKYFSIFGHQNPGSGLDPNPYSAENSGPGSNEYGPKHWLPYMFTTRSTQKHLWRKYGTRNICVFEYNRHYYWFLSCLGWGEACGGRAGQLPPAPPVPGAEAGRPQCGHRARHSLVPAFTLFVLHSYFWAFILVFDSFTFSN